MYTQIHACVPIYLHAHIPAHIHLCMHTCQHKNMPTWIKAHMPTFLCAHIHTCIILCTLHTYRLTFSYALMTRCIFTTLHTSSRMYNFFIFKSTLKCLPFCAYWSTSWVYCWIILLTKASRAIDPTGNTSDCNLLLPIAVRWSGFESRLLHFFYIKYFGIILHFNIKFSDITHQFSWYFHFHFPYPP